MAALVVFGFFRGRTARRRVSLCLGHPLNSKGPRRLSRGNTPVKNSIFVRLETINNCLTNLVPVYLIPGAPKTFTSNIGCAHALRHGAGLSVGPGAVGALREVPAARHGWHGRSGKVIDAAEHGNKTHQWKAHTASCSAPATVANTGMTDSHFPRGTSLTRGTRCGHSCWRERAGVSWWVIRLSCRIETILKSPGLQRGNLIFLIGQKESRS